MVLTNYQHYQNRLRNFSLKKILIKILNLGIMNNFLTRKKGFYESFPWPLW